MANGAIVLPERDSVLDIPSFSIGEMLIPFSDDDDFLGEMLEERFELPGPPPPCTPSQHS